MASRVVFRGYASPRTRPANHPRFLGIIFLESGETHSGYADHISIDKDKGNKEVDTHIIFVIAVKMNKTADKATLTVFRSTAMYARNTNCVKSQLVIQEQSAERT